MELAHGLVAPALILGGRRRLLLVRRFERGPEADLREVARDQVVVDLDAGDVADELAWRDDPPDPPADHALLDSRSDGHGPVAHAGERRWHQHWPPVEEHVLVDAPVEER